MNVHTETDEVLAKKVQAGDTASFGELMHRYEARLVRYGKKYLAREEDIEDVVQDVFLKTYENIHSYNPSYRFSPWIYRIAHNAFVNVLRRDSHRSFAFFDFDTLVAPLSQTTPNTHEHSMQVQRHAIDSVLKELSPKYREVLVLHYFEELSYDEIAEVLHVPIGTVGVRLKRAREALRTLCIEHHITYE